MDPLSIGIAIAAGLIALVLGFYFGRNNGFLSGKATGRADVLEEQRLEARSELSIARDEAKRKMPKREPVRVWMRPMKASTAAAKSLTAKKKA
jgi:hypothetical protein